MSKDPEHELPPAGLRTLPDDRYGKFRPAGEGGMGIVYWAIDTDLNREVAFKIIRPGATGGTGDAPKRPTQLTPPAAHSHDSRSFRALKQRFLQEAWITSSMAHPGIVPVYELGQTAEGVPYYTMRFIGGDRTLATAILEAREQDVEERLALLEPFLKVCDAVRYAHSRGVIHRDLKPKNIAIGEYGEVVLLDWGLAKFKGSLDPDLDDRLQAHVREYREAHDLQSVAVALGTPGYMGPEAARGESAAMDERSDVYSLGVMLFEILTGRLPFEFQSFGDLAAKLLNEDAPNAQDLDPSVPVVLSSLCGACLSRKMDDRPASVGALADAIRRWQVERERELKVEGLVREALLALSVARESEGAARIRELDLAISANGRLERLCPEHPRVEEFSAAIARLRERGIRERDRTTRRRILKRVGVLGLTAATAVAVLVAILMDGQRRSTELAHDREFEQRARAEDLAAYMLGDLRDELQPLGRLDLLRKVASKSLEYYENVPKASLTKNDRHARGLALGNIGDVLLDSGDMSAAEKLYRESMEIFEGLVAEDPGNREWQRDLSVSRNRLGDVRQETGKLKDALELYREALAIRRELVKSGQVEPLARDDVARTLDRIGDVLIRLGDRGPAMEMFRESLTIRRRLIADEPDEGEWWDQLAASLVKIGDSRTKTGDLPSALASYKEAEAILNQVLKETPTSSQRRDSLGGCVFRIGYVLENTGDKAGALERYQQSLAIYRGLGAGDPSHAWWQRNIALGLDRVGDLVKENGDHETALRHYQEAQQIRQAVHEKDSGNTRAAHDLVTSHISVGDFAKATNDLDTARSSYEAALEIARGLAAKEPDNTEWQTDVSHALNRRASIAWKQKDTVAAARDYREAVGILRKLSEKDPAQTEMQRNLSLNLQSLGDLARDEKDLPAARKLYEECLEISRPLAASDPANHGWQTGLVTDLNRLANLASLMNDPAIALKCHEEAVVVNRRLLTLSPDDAERLRGLSYSLYYAGVLHEAAGHVPEALAALREAEALHGRAAALDSRHAAEHHFWATAYQRVVLAAGDGQLETTGDSLTLAYGLLGRKEHAAAMQQFAMALEDMDIRTDLRRGNLYNAACAAALSGAPEKAMAWLTEDLEIRRASLAVMERDLSAATEKAEKEDLRQRIEAVRAHFEHARAKDPDLESLRARQDFTGLFE